MSWPRAVLNEPWLAGVVVGALLSALVGVIAAGYPGLYRPLFAVGLGMALLTAGIVWPRETAVTTLALLCFIALIRRLLIDSAGWTASDPLLLVAPLLVAALLARTHLIAERSFSKDKLVLAVYGLLTLMTLQVLNPSGSGLGAALGGLLFLAVPLLWFLAGRELADREIIHIAAYGVIVVGVIAAIYGLVQTQVGFPEWDQNWISVTHIASLNIGMGQLRGFAMFSSAAEYKQIVAMATMAALALGLHGRPAAFLVLPLLLTSLVLSGARNAIALTLLGLLLVMAVRIRTGRFAVGVTVLGIVLSVVAVGALSNSLGQVASDSTNAAVARQAKGFSNPLDPESSTLPGHVTLVTNGLVDAFRRPLGSGTAAANLAGARAGAPASTEVDVTDVFLSLGVLGGLMYLFIVTTILRRVVSQYRQSRDVLLLVTFGFLIVSITAWLKGAHYAAASILWFFAGWATTEASSHPSAAATVVRRGV
jgi:hypothetical protein